MIWMADGVAAFPEKNRMLEVLGLLRRLPRLSFHHRIPGHDQVAFGAL